MNRGCFLPLLLGLWLPVVGHAEDPGAFASERARLAKERASIDARFSERAAECQSRFAVTDCVDEAKKEQRESLVPLRRREIALDDAQRRERTARRQEDVRKKLESAQAVREREVVLRKPVAPAAAASAAGDPPEAASQGKVPRETKLKPAPRPTAKREPKAPMSATARRDEEAANQARIDARKQAAQAHREEAERRQAEKARSGKLANPLPVPASGALP